MAPTGVLGDRAGCGCVMGLVGVAAPAPRPTVGTGPASECGETGYGDRVRRGVEVRYDGLGECRIGECGCGMAGRSFASLKDDMGALKGDIERCVGLAVSG